MVSGAVMEGSGEVRVGSCEFWWVLVGFLWVLVGSGGVLVGSCEFWWVLVQFWWVLGSGFW